MARLECDGRWAWPAILFSRSETNAPSAGETHLSLCQTTCVVMTIYPGRPTDKTAARRRRILARAISRIIVHEMTHLVTESSLHARSGLQKAQVSSSDLLAYKTD
jgi:hypothetical protein